MMIEQIQRTEGFIPHTSTVEMQADSVQSAKEVRDASSVDFSSLLQDMAQEAIGKIKKAEDVSLTALQGKTSMREAIDCIMQAERTLQVSIALRDKIVSSALEISKMQI
ncbi:flagellar hook-basal body protein FliE [Candidatus Liberibacter solanacearum]|uniref:Flagellar hook-basal body complex protein FliE n=2 Tax=Candidatus Liberibacter solanacearum TaxID=556287 RepID=A0A3R7TJL0_9HYPH|nr:flagellar hook-basal body protein FliE [Candidatus Liberibacter solanacearum]KJZ80877.1 flagellar hook-basal body protein FliE [Candidatus Liberibacter solanacearum]KQC49554.1 flagellar hook-basal body protein FliE [Candidatus Liberibacter solanacearum]RPD37692.1 flagellar hook-basal body protein FliE [Candidatus Liberibacter solanacearum]